MFCKNCGSENYDDDKFCGVCGAALVNEQLQQVYQPEPQENYLDENQLPYYEPMAQQPYQQEPQYYEPTQQQQQQIWQQDPQFSYYEQMPQQMPPYQDKKAKRAKKQKDKNTNKSKAPKIIIAIAAVLVLFVGLFSFSLMFGADTESVGEVYYQEISAENVVYDEDLETYYINNQLLITTNEGVSKSKVEDIISEYDGVIVGYIEITNDYQVELSGEMTLGELDEIVEELLADKDIYSVYIHEIFETNYDYITNDLEYVDDTWSVSSPAGLNWGLEAIDAVGAWDYLEQMQTVKVGIIDSVFDSSHEDLVYEEVFYNPDNLFYNESDADSYAAFAHGTHVSGILAAKVNNELGISGVASNVELYGYALWGEDYVDLEDNEIVFTTYFEFKYALSILITNDCKVINVSMSCSDDLDEQAEVYGEFFSKMLSRGYDFVIVQAAGNASTNASKAGLFTGIEIEEVKDRIIVVGAIGVDESYSDSDDTQTLGGYYYAEFSNYDERVDVVAPGVDIYSTVPNNEYEDSFEINGQMISWSGTSMAAPYVSGIAALCYSVNPDLTGDQVKDIIVNSYSTTVTKVVSSSQSYTYPLVNAKTAVEFALEMKASDEVVFEDTTETGVVMGTVSGDYEDIIIACGETGSYINNYSTIDSEGNFEIILQEGVYDIFVSCSGYNSITFSSVEVKEGEITYLGEFELIAQGVEEEAIDLSNLLGIWAAKLNIKSYPEITLIRISQEIQSEYCLGYVYHDFTSGIGEGVTSIYFSVDDIVETQTNVYEIQGVEYAMYEDVGEDCTFTLDCSELSDSIIAITNSYGTYEYEYIGESYDILDEYEEDLLTDMNLTGTQEDLDSNADTQDNSSNDNETTTQEDSSGDNETDTQEESSNYVDYITFVEEKQYISFDENSYGANYESYAILDIDENGVDELLVINNNEIDFMHTLIFTYDDSNEIVLVEDIYSYGYVKYSKSDLCITYSDFKSSTYTGGIGFYYLNNSNQLKLNYSIGWDVDDSMEVYYFMYETTKTTLTKDEYSSKTALISAIDWVSLTS